LASFSATSSIANTALSNQVSVVGSKVDQLSTSLFPVLSTLATAAAVTNVSNQVSVVGSKVDQLSTSLFPVLSTLATAAALSGASAANVLATSIVGSKVDKLSTSIFPILASITTKVSVEPIAVTAAGTINTSGSYKLANNVSGDFIITATGVTFDLNGYTISATGGGTGITALGNNIWIKNGFVSGGSFGIAANGSDNFTIENCICTGATNTGISIGIGAMYGVVRNCQCISCAIGVVLSVVSFISVYNTQARNCTTGFNSNNASTTSCEVAECTALNCSIGFLNHASGTSNRFYSNRSVTNTTPYTNVSNAPLTSSTDLTMNYWKNYQG
jgi:nitrous oxidase accessory protein NosD